MIVGQNKKCFYFIFISCSFAVQGYSNKYCFPNSFVGKTMVLFCLKINMSENMVSFSYFMENMP